MEIVDSSYKNWMKHLVRYRDEFSEFSKHHQAADHMGKGLEVVLKADHITKLFLSKDGLILGSQIHPEVHVFLNKMIKEGELHRSFER